MIENHNTLIVIPARMASNRLPGKPLADLNGQPMILHVWRRAVDSGLGRVLVAAAEIEIAETVRRAGGDAIVTSPGLAAGGDRIAEALGIRDPEGRYSHVLGLPCDVPTIDLLAIQRCLAGLVNDAADISTIATRIDDPAETASPAVVKVIAALDDRREVAFARDFVRQLPPGTPEPHWRHVNAYAYRRAALDRFAALPVSPREAEHRIEPLRALDNGLRIVVVRVDSIVPTVDMPEDLERVRLLLRKTP